MSPDAIMAYLEPIGALLEGAVAEALTYDKDWKNVRPLMRAIFDALHLPTKAAEYAAICNDADIWLDIKLWTRDKLFQKKKMQLCLPDICYVSFLDDFRKEYSLLEVPLLAGNQKGTGQNPRTSLSLALLSAFGESVHHDDIVAASKKPEAYKGMTFMLKLCLLRVFMVQSEPLYMTQYVVSYLVATLDYILDSLRKDQYSLPDGIDTLHEKLKAVVDKRMYVRCDPHFFSIVQRYLRLFEGQILSTLTAFSAMRVSKEDLQRLDSSPRILQTLNKIAFSWKFQVCTDCYLSCLCSLI